MKMVQNNEDHYEKFFFVSFFSAFKKELYFIHHYKGLI